MVCTACRCAYALAIFLLIFGWTDALDFEEIFRITPDGDDYSPFQSKVHALAYMLINSPRPMVS